MITRPEESYRLWRVVVCDQDTSNEEAKARYGAVENTTRRVLMPRKQTQQQANLSFDNQGLPKVKQYLYMPPSVVRRRADSFQ